MKTEKETLDEIYKVVEEVQDRVRALREDDEPTRPALAEGFFEIADIVVRARKQVVE